MTKNIMGRFAHRLPRMAFITSVLLTCAVGAQDFPADPAQSPMPVPIKPSANPPPAGRKLIAPIPAPIASAPSQAAIDALQMGPPAPIENLGPPYAAPEPGIAPAQVEPAETAADPSRLVLLNETIEPGTRRELQWKIGESFDGNEVAAPVFVIRGNAAGTKLCLFGAIHGDELNGIEVIRRVLNETDPAALNGTLIGVPIVNLLGFSRGVRYLPDRRDLNRYFPGTDYGSAASRIAYSLFHEIVVHCDAVVDFHTGSFDRANLPQVRGNLTIPQVLAFTKGFGATAVLHSPGSKGMLRVAAEEHDIPTVTFEVGAPGRLEPQWIDFAVQAISTLMHHMGMTRSFRLWAEPQATFYESKWVRADHGGMLFATVALGDRVRENERLGKIIDPIKNEEHIVLAPFRGRVIGMALNQIVLPGFAAFHIGIETTDAHAAEEAAQPVQDPESHLEGDEMPTNPDPEDTEDQEQGLPPNPEE